MRRAGVAEVFEHAERRAAGFGQSRHPSVLSRDFRKEEGEYEDFDNLFARDLFRNLGRYAVRVDASTKALAIERAANPMAYPQAVELATRSAEAESAGFLRRKAQAAPK